MIAEITCAISFTCALAGEIDLPFRYIGKPYDTTRACYIRGEFHRQCPGPPEFEDYKLMTKAEYKKQLLDYVDKQLDKLTVKKIRVLIASYVK
tara:strand:- start:489 stop:767 length:279 start_codon:yes stop_codon:yes gene_type:complete